MLVKRLMPQALGKQPAGEAMRSGIWGRRQALPHCCWRRTEVHSDGLFDGGLDIVFLRRLREQHVHREGAARDGEALRVFRAIRKVNARLSTQSFVMRTWRCDRALAAHAAIDQLRCPEGQR